MHNQKSVSLARFVQAVATQLVDRAGNKTLEKMHFWKALFKTDTTN